MSIIFGPSAASSIWADAREKVRADLWRPSAGAVPDDQCDRALHSAIRELEAFRKWHWLDNLDGTLNIAVSADSFELGDGVKRINSLAYLSGTSSYDILSLEPTAAIRQAARGASVGAPSAFAFVNGTIYFDCPVPDDSDFELNAMTACPALVEDAIATPPASLTLHMSTIVPNAARYVALGYLKNETEAARQGAVYQRYLDILCDEDDAVRAHGVVQPDDFYFHAAHGI